MDKTTANNEYKKGVLSVVLCMFLWGTLPIYWKSLIPISSSVIIIYRILLVFVTSVLVARKDYTFKEIFAPLKNKRLALKYFFAGFIITANWSVYIWAVNAGYLIQTSIGYYIEPLAVCLLGILLFKEKLTRYKTIAIALACAAVIVILVHFGELPGIALGLVLTFSVYSAIKRTVNEPPMISLVYETVFLAPIALGIIIYLEVTGQGALGVGQPYQYVLLMLCGPLTAIPLALFASAAQKTSMFILGLAEYISPTLQLILGVFLYHEVVDSIQFVAFAIIWVGLVFFTYGEFSDYRKSVAEANAARQEA